MVKFSQCSVTQPINSTPHHPPTSSKDQPSFSPPRSPLPANLPRPKVGMSRVSSWAWKTKDFRRIRNRALLRPQTPYPFPVKTTRKTKGITRKALGCPRMRPRVEMAARRTWFHWLQHANPVRRFRIVPSCVRRGLEMHPKCGCWQLFELTGCRGNAAVCEIAVLGKSLLVEHLLRNSLYLSVNTQL